MPKHPAEVPIERLMYYYPVKWWLHPIKRYKQKKHLKNILETN